MATSGAIFIIYCTPEAAVWFRDDVGKRRDRYMFITDRNSSRHGETSHRGRIMTLKTGITYRTKVKYMHEDCIHTCDLTAIELEAQSDAVLPSQGSDPDEPRQDGLWDPVQDDFRGVGVGKESLQRRNRKARISKILLMQRNVSNTNKQADKHRHCKQACNQMWPRKIILLIAGQTNTHFHTSAHAAMA